MLDYALDKEEKKTFVLNYKSLGEYIKVNVASGDDYSVPNTKDNEKNLLSKMEEQADDPWQFVNKQEKRKKSAIGWLIYDAAFLILNTVMMCLDPCILTGVCIGLFLLAGSAQIVVLKDVKAKLDDVKKHELFLRHKISINEYLEKGNCDVKEETMIPVKEEKEDILNINDVHDMTYEDVSKIVTDIQRDRQLGIDRPKVLIKQYLPNKK